jgi:hypothetical protein
MLSFVPGIVELCTLEDMSVSQDTLPTSWHTHDSCSRIEFQGLGGLVTSQSICLFQQFRVEGLGFQKERCLT